MKHLRLHTFHTFDLKAFGYHESYVPTLFFPSFLSLKINLNYWVRKMLRLKIDEYLRTLNYSRLNFTVSVWYVLGRMTIVVVLKYPDIENLCWDSKRELNSQLKVRKNKSRVTGLYLNLIRINGTYPSYQNLKALHCIHYEQNVVGLSYFKS